MRHTPLSYKRNRKLRIFSRKLVEATAAVWYNAAKPKGGRAMTFAEKLQAFRKRGGLSQEELAERLKVSRQSVSKWELCQAFPETAKLIELSRMMGVTVDELLKEEGGAAPPPNAPPNGSGRRGRAPWMPGLIRIACVLFVIAALLIAFRPWEDRSGKPSEPSAAPIWDIEPSAPAHTAGPPTAEPAPSATVPRMRELRAYYFDFARQYRLDYVPFYELGDAPTDSTEYLFFAFALNLDNWGEDKGIMSKEYVDETAMAYFGVTGLTHRSMWKGWDYDGERYTALPQGIKSLPICFLADYRTYEEGGTQRHEITLDFLDYSHGMEATPEEDAAARELIAAGNLGSFKVISREAFVYRENSNLNFGRPVFLAHTVVEPGDEG